MQFRLKIPGAFCSIVDIDFCSSIALCDNQFYFEPIFIDFLRTDEKFIKDAFFSLLFKIFSFLRTTLTAHCTIMLYCFLLFTRARWIVLFLSSSSSSINKIFTKINSSFEWNVWRAIHRNWISVKESFYYDKKHWATKKLIMHFGETINWLSSWHWSSRRNAIRQRKRKVLRSNRTEVHPKKQLRFVL